MTGRKHESAAGRRPSRWSAGVSLAISAAVAACLGETNDTAATEFEEMDADEVLYGVEHNMTNNGVREALLTADSMYSWRDSANTWVIGLTLQVFDERTGDQQATITADRGRLDMAGNELKAIGNVVLDIPDQDREIRTEELDISPDSDRMWSDIPVVMRQEGCEVEGDRFESDMSFGRVKLWGTRERDCPDR